MKKGSIAKLLRGEGKREDERRKEGEEMGWFAEEEKGRSSS